MKRSGKDKLHKTKRIKKDITHRLNDDLVYEILTWLPSLTLLEDCVLVCRQWKSVIENYCELVFELNSATWPSFFQWVEHPIAQRVRELSLIEDFRGFSIDGSRLNCLVGLKRLTFRGFCIGKELIEHVVKNVAIETIVIEECWLKWSDLSPLLHHERQLFVIIDGVDIRAHEIEEAARIPGLVSLMSMDRYWFTFSERGALDEKSRIRAYESLTKAKHLSSLSVYLDDVCSRYLPSMENLTCLTILAKSETIGRLPDLRRLSRLREINLRQSLLTVPRTDGSSIPEQDAESMLDPVIHQLTHIRAWNTCFISDDDWEKLYSLDNVTSLELLRGPLTLVGSPSHSFFTRLTNLRLIDIVVSGATLEAIKDMKTLIKIHIQRTSITGNGTESHFTFDDLCHDADGFPYCLMSRLTSICLDCPPLGSKALSVLQSMNSLNHLYLSACNTEDGVHLDQIALSRSITHLEIPGVPTLDDAVCLSSMKQLRKLTFSGYMPLKADHLFHVSRMESLRHLDLYWVTIDTEGLKHVASMTNLRSLSLDLGVSDKPISLLSTMNHLRTLVVFLPEEDEQDVIRALGKSFSNLIVNRVSIQDSGFV